ncbi:MAG: hypothetical protein FWC79_01880 [Oscillospiraceae bacterium]|nr:hypothetical protein [Oscillospiraceae bacterium]
MNHLRAKYLELYTKAIKRNFKNIVAGKITKKALAAELGIDQMTLGSLIEEIYKDDKAALQDYQTIKGVNSRLGGKFTRKHKEKNERRDSIRESKGRFKREDFLMLNKEEKIKWIIHRYNTRQMKTEDANIRTEEGSRQDIMRFIDYFTSKRNNLVAGQRNNFDEDKILCMLFENPGALSPSEDKKETVFKYLDSVPGIGADNANRIASRYPGILTQGVERTISQVKIMKDFKMLDKFIKNPKAFIPSPETIYALTMFAKEYRFDSDDHFEATSASNILIGRQALFLNYDGLTYEDLYERYPLPDKYIITEDKVTRELFTSQMTVKLDPKATTDSANGEGNSNTRTQNGIPNVPSKEEK